MGAIKRKHGESKKSVECNLSTEGEKVVLTIIHSHYSITAMFYDLSNDELRRKGLALLIQFLSGRNDSHVHNYLLHNWYNMENWLVWGHPNFLIVSLVV